jgi:DNA-binding CsgD family transcriptional regulator/tetratricopeptide (TPR) repeat protein
VSPLGTSLVGRESITQVIDDALDGAGGGRGSVLLLRGDAGIGKTAILRAAQRSAAEREMLVLTAAGVSSEARDPFAGLSQLVDRSAIPDHIGAEQDGALRAALGTGRPSAPELFRIALETLSLLTAEAARRPLLIAVDDLQWLDHETASVLAFLGRRISNDSIVLIAARRDRGMTPLDEPQFRELLVAPLDDTAARALLRTWAPRLEPWVRERILATAAGNALALRELPTVIDGQDVDPLAPLPLTEALQLAFGERFRGLPHGARTLLLLVALNDRPSFTEVFEAARYAHEALDFDDAMPAAEAGLVDVDVREIRFRHPLMRDAVIQASSLEERLTGHRLLARALVTQPDRAVWHRAASTLGADDEIASELEEASERSQQRGALETAIVALERAAQLSADRQDRNRRLLRAAVVALELGRRTTTERLIDQVSISELGPVDSARRLLVAETIRPSSPENEQVAHTLVDSADRMRIAGEEDLALELLWVAANTGFWADRGPQSAERTITALGRFGLKGDDARGLSITAYAKPIDRGSEVIARIAKITCDPATDPSLTGLIANAAVTLGALDLAIPFMDAAVDGLRRDGRLGQLAQTLILRGWASTHLGRRETAEADGAESVRIAAETKQPIWEGAGRVIEAMTLGYAGSVDEAFAILNQAEEIGMAVRGRALLNVVQLARGAIQLSNGRARDAFGSLHRMFDRQDPSYHSVESSWAIGLLADAALLSGREADVRPLVEYLAGQAKQFGSPWLKVSLRHACAVLAAPECAERAFAVAFGADLAHWPLDRARLHLAYGRSLRGAQRWEGSKASFRAARDAFDALGAEAWGRRAREELEDAGEASGPRVPHPSERLTPQELQIARLAAQGLTNREIASMLFLSPRTVGSHLYRVFPKLGIGDRRELRLALQQPQEVDERAQPVDRN